MKKTIALLLAAALLLAGMPTALAANGVPDTVSEAYIVMDAKTGQVLLEKNMHQREYPASITKILTTALGLLHSKEEAIITVSAESVNDVWQWGETTHLALEAGERITLRDALSGTMVESANDCANAVAQAVSGTLPAFTKLMNEQVAALGLQDTHFTNAHGLPDKDHYTTAYDMAMITRWALSVEGFEEYFGMLEYTIPKTNKKNTARNIGTHHHMLVESAYYYEYSKGGKLGWTSDAQHTIVTWAERDGLSLICVALDCSDKWAKYTDSIALFDYCFDRYTMVSVTAEDIADFDVPIGTISRPTGVVHISAAQNLDILVPYGTATESLALRYQIPARYATGERINPCVDIYCGGELVGSIPMEYTVESYAIVEDVPEEPRELPQWVSVALTVLKWVGIVLGALVVILLLLRCYFMARRKRRRKQYLERKRRMLEQQRRLQQMQQTRRPPY